MDERVARIESELDSLREELARVRARLSSVEEAVSESVRAGLPVHEASGPEQRPPATSADGVSAESVGSGPATPDADVEAGEAPVLLGARLVGGVLLVIAGGYLLRALTEAGTLPGAVGVVIGFAYALVWTVVGHLLAARGRPRSAAANGIVTALLGFPLVREATTRFELLSPLSGAMLLLALAVVLLHMARRHGLTSVAWVAVLGLGGAAVASMFETRAYEPYVLALLLAGLLFAAWGRRHWPILAWVAYGLVNLTCLLLLVGAIGVEPITRPALAVPLLAATFFGFLGIFVLRAWRTGELALDEAAQGTVVTLLGFGGALLLARDEIRTAATVLAFTGLLLGGAGYVVLMTALRWTREHRWPFLLYSSLALATVAMAVVALFPAPAWVFAILAAVLAAAGAWLDRTSPSLHAGMSLLLAAIASGLVAMVRQSLTGGVDPTDLELAPAALATIAAAIFCSLLPLKVRGPVWPAWLPRTVRAGVTLVAVLGIDVLLLQRLVPVIVGQLEGPSAAAAAAALRTGVAAALIVVLALLSHWHRLQPASWLIYPLLALVGFKLVMVDFPQGRPIALAIALLLYGGALILAPRWSAARTQS